MAAHTAWHQQNTAAKLAPYTQKALESTTQAPYLLPELGLVDGVTWHSPNKLVPHCCHTLSAFGERHGLVQQRPVTSQPAEAVRPWRDLPQHVRHLHNPTTHTRAQTAVPSHIEAHMKKGKQHTPTCVSHPVQCTEVCACAVPTYPRPPSNTNALTHLQLLQQRQHLPQITVIPPHPVHTHACGSTPAVQPSRQAGSRQAQAT